MSLNGYRQSRRLRGLCVDCARPAVTVWYCEEHREKHRLKSVLHRSKYRAEGKCARCGVKLNPDLTIKVCVECYDEGFTRLRYWEGRL